MNNELTNLGLTTYNGGEYRIIFPPLPLPTHLNLRSKIMRNLLILGVLLAVMSGCSLVCDVAKTGTKLVSTSIAKKWSCNEAKLYDFIVKPVSSVLCEKEDENASGLAKLACQITMETLTGLGADQIVAKFDCDPALVAADLNNAGKICDYVEVEAAKVN